jgi:hypothetical protein
MMGSLEALITDDSVLLATALVMAVAVLMGRRIEAKIGKVYFQLNPNGGKTLRDGLDRVEHIVKKLDRRLDSLELRTTTLEDHETQDK